MIVFVDASAMVAIMTGKDDSLALERAFGAATRRLCSAMSLWEAARAIARKRRITTENALREIEHLLKDFEVGIVTVGEAEARAAIAAHDRYGKGNHAATLNMGDCFSYACARTNQAKLLYKGNDFALTDLA